MGCGGSKEKLTPAEKRAMMMQKAMKSANKPTQAQLNRRESTHLVINISEELQRWDGTNELENVKLEDRYQHVKALGAGAFGTVSKVERMGDLKMLAAKEILRERCVQQEQWQLALQETRTWKELSSPYHPAILQLIEVLYTADKSIYLLTEVMPGGELAEAFDHMEMTEQKCRLIAVQITAAIGHLHMAHSMASPSPIERGLDITGGGLNVARPCARAATSRGRALAPPRRAAVRSRRCGRALDSRALSQAHRDVKPQNVLCRRRRNPMQVGCLKLADFGFCAKVESLTKPQFRLYCGSLDYFAPELAQMVVGAWARAAPPLNSLLRPAGIRWSRAAPPPPLRPPPLASLWALRPNSAVFAPSPPPLAQPTSMAPSTVSSTAPTSTVMPLAASCTRCCTAIRPIGTSTKTSSSRASPTPRDRCRCPR